MQSLNIKDLINETKQKLNIKTDQDLCKLLNISISSLALYKKKNKLSKKMLLKINEINLLSNSSLNKKTQLNNLLIELKKMLNENNIICEINLIYKEEIKTI